MKNEPTVVYNHLQEEENEHSATGHSPAENRTSWKNLIHPIAIAIEIAAIVTMAFFMIQEMFK